MHTYCRCSSTCTCSTFRTHAFFFFFFLRTLTDIPTESLGKALWVTMWLPVLVMFCHNHCSPHSKKSVRLTALDPGHKVSSDLRFLLAGHHFWQSNKAKSFQEGLFLLFSLVLRSSFEVNVWCYCPQCLEKYEQECTVERFCLEFYLLKL